MRLWLYGTLSDGIPCLHAYPDRRGDAPRKAHVWESGKIESVFSRCVTLMDRHSHFAPGCTKVKTEKGETYWQVPNTTTENSCALHHVQVGNKTMTVLAYWDRSQSNSKDAFTAYIIDQQCTFDEAKTILADETGLDTSSLTLTEDNTN